jgi:hypothetical protein
MVGFINVNMDNFLKNSSPLWIFVLGIAILFLLIFIASWLFLK